MEQFAPLLHKTARRSHRGGSQKYNFHKRRLAKTQKKCSIVADGQKRPQGSCYPPNILHRIKQEFNAGAEGRSRPIRAVEPNALWRELRDRLRPTCADKEECWLNQIRDKAWKREIETTLFLPKKPPNWRKNPNEWLTNYDILKVLRQYEKRYVCFKFIGPAPIDFDAAATGEKGDCVWPELCRFNLAKHLRKGKKRFGVIFNLDRHDEPGSHWVSLFIDVPNQFLFYFDSNGEAVPPQIDRLMDRVIAQAAEQGIVMQKLSNHPQEHQRENTECGVYSLFFIITMLTCKTEFHAGELTLQDKLDLFRKEQIPDKYMEQYRNVYFSD